MGILLALLSALAYGVVDFSGGLLSRRASFIAVALIAQAASLALMLFVAAAVPAPHVEPADLAWGALSGVGTGTGMLFLYRGLSRGAMSVVVPVSAVSGVALSVVVGVFLLGDRPSALSWEGIVLAGPALWLVSWERRRAGLLASPAVADALIASVGIAVQYLALARAGQDSGAWPVTAGRVTAMLALLPVAVSSHSGVRVPGRIAIQAVLIGGLAAVALFLYLLATRQELVVISVVVASLYPVLPVLLGITLLHERLTRVQAMGLVAAGGAVALLTLG